MYINGFYPAGKEPTTVAGLEGSGTVVDAKGIYYIRFFYNLK